jgi:hypothetical protein
MNAGLSGIRGRSACDRHRELLLGQNDLSCSTRRVHLRFCPLVPLLALVDRHGAKDECVRCRWSCRRRLWAEPQARECLAGRHVGSHTENLCATFSRRLVTRDVHSLYH